MPPQSTLIHNVKGLCLLSLDAGGSRSISQLKILAEIMHRSNFDVEEDQKKYPCSMFDMIGGSGSGGFIAILLVVFGSTAEQALEEYIKLTINVLDKKGMDAEARTAALKVYSQDLVERHNLKNDIRLLDQNVRAKGCKLVVPISYKRHVGSTCTLRNFNVRQEQALNLTITEAIMATLTTPPLFTPTSIFKDAATFEYIGADLILRNPIREVITEAQETYEPEQHVACILSLGCGHPGINSAPDDSNLDNWYRFLEKLAKDGEQTAQNMDAQIGHLGLYHRLCVINGLEWTEPATTAVDPGHIITHTSTYLADVSVSRKMDTCVDSLKIRDGVATLEQLKHSGGRTGFTSALPPLTRTFIMRREPMDFIERAMLGPPMPDAPVGPRMLAVTGIGGCGKTQIALKFISLHKEQFPSSFCVDGSSEAHIRADTIRHVRSLGPTESQMSFEECLLYLSKPSPTGPWLILYDNVDDPELELGPLLPQGESCIILITSRNRSIGDLCPDAHLELDIMSFNEAMELLLYTPSHSAAIPEQHRKDAHTIAEALGCLPLALTQARSYMYQTRCSPGDYLKRLQQSRKELLSQPVKYQQGMRYLSTYAAFNASFGMLRQRVQKLLQILSFLHWSNFPLELIALAAQHHFSKYEFTYTEHGDEHALGRATLEDIFLLNGEWRLTHLDEMTTALQNYSLASLVPGVDTMLIEMHSLAHEWVHFCIPDDDRRAYQSAAILLLALGARDNHTPSMQYLSSHIMHLSPLWNQLHINAAEAFARGLESGGFFQGALQLREQVTERLREQAGPRSIDLSNSLWQLAITYRDLGRFQEAEVLQLEVLKLRKELLGDHHLRTIMSSSNLAVTYRDLGRFQEAEVLQAEVLGLRKELLGDLHLETIQSTENLALTYRDLGRFQEAEVLQVEVLKLRKDLLGDRHLSTMKSSLHLALTYRDLGHFQLAEVLQLETVRLSKEILGNRHPITIAASTNLALTYRDQGRFQEAEVLQVEELRWRRELFFDQHPETLESSARLALTYRDMGRYQEAQVLQVETLRVKKEILGDRHPATIASSLNLALTYCNLGRFQEAEVLQIETLRLSKEILGDRHPTTIMVSTSLALTYRDLGRYQDAEVLQVETLRLNKEIRGDRHPTTIESSLNLALTYCNLGRFQEAEVLQIETLRLSKEILGDRHPTTIMVSTSLALTYRDLGRYQDAEVLQVETLRLNKEIRGDRHPTTIESSLNLALTYCNLGRFQEAEVLQIETLRLSKEILGDRHPTTIMVSTSLAVIYRDLGRYQDAEVLQVEILRLNKELLGDRHPTTIASSLNLALTYCDLGRFQEAEVLQIETLRLSKEILGDRHPTTIAASLNLAVTYCDLGRFQEAEALQAEVLMLREEILGNRHPKTIASCESLAITYCNHGRFQEAEVLQAEVLRLRKELLGDLHPKTIGATETLALTYHELGRFQEAEVLQTEVLRLRKEILGDRHPETIWSLDNLANTYCVMGRFQEAEVLQIDALRMNKEIIGDRHPDTANSSHGLALIYRDCGRLEEAEMILKNVIELQKEIKGERHQHTIEASDDMAVVLRLLGRLNEAETLATEVLQLKLEILGNRHPNTLVSSHNLAAVYRDIGRLDEAEVLQLETLGLMREILGERHPTTTNAMLLLAEIYLSLHRKDLALKLLIMAEGIIPDILGIEHPQYLKCQEIKDGASRRWWKGFWTILARRDYLDHMTLAETLILLLSLLLVVFAYFLIR